MKNICLILIFILPFLWQCSPLKRIGSYCTPPKYIGKFYIFRKERAEYLNFCMRDSLFNATLNRKVPRAKRKIKGKRDAIKLVEPLLFKKFGEEDTKSERPYQVYLVNGFWVVKGTLSRQYCGGTFTSVVDAESGEVMFNIHSK